MHVVEVHSKGFKCHFMFFSSCAKKWIYKV